MARVLLFNLLFVGVILGGIWAIRMSLNATKRLRTPLNTLVIIEDWYGYFFGVALIVLGIAGIMGAFY